ncbi:peptidase domain-containing ABC transporter [Pseudoflavitalea sp. G-6-1-2]|uniref:peptidase domain-containing ABC transporter n=1 Tax=Pseudoflavitalea sp. G-6-1-2 TaxID=2728841 RepID=UPI00146DA072|nr:peptidase domain-containing ABC transporter [Pseudoflavitalea sp. G-6-1-2]NML20834.1 peptidase domain-containing ABC transporter [Pseudoflavitalea sp. G-6-1-2]
MSFPFYTQLDTMDCGPTCLRMIAKYYGKEYTLENLRQRSFISREGVSLLGISQAAESIGFRSLNVQLSFDQLDEEATLPCILFWNQEHFVVLPPQNYNSNSKRATIQIADPAHGLVRVDKETFLRCWTGPQQTGIALLLEPTDAFYQKEDDVKERRGFRFLFRYLKPYKRYLLQLILSMLFASLLSLIFPLLTQGLVDYGISRNNLQFVYLVLLSQLLLFVGSTAIDLIRSWMLLHINSRINLSILSDFLIKLMKLPIRFFDSKLLGDLLQRIQDHTRIQEFLTGTALHTMFSMLNLAVFAVVLGIYSGSILMVFLFFSTLSVVWITFFLKRRRDLDYKRFQRMSDSQNNIYELITGMQEIKLNNCETQKRWEWERIQAKLYKISIKTLALEQYQQVGSVFFNQLKNILISYISARSVMAGDMTLGMMLSVSYIIGQMNSPVEQLLGFIKSAQDAGISLSRLGEIHNRENEEPPNEATEKTLPEDYSIALRNISFQYEGPQSPWVLKNIHLLIPEGKVTAIVGSSGSGKTTLLKLLLRFYDSQQGEIAVGGKSLQAWSPAWWRSQCGTVMQDGFIFSDTIAKNIAVSDDEPDDQKMRDAARVANIHEFIESLALGYQSRVGNTGNSISAGQRQRLLIARAVYKNPQYLFFDEATSALDANNERVIMRNLQQFFKGKTVVVIAHRLSTVRHADQIIVLEHGEIKETGTHETLTARRGNYYQLVKNQLELGNS